MRIVSGTVPNPTVPTASGGRQPERQRLGPHQVLDRLPRPGAPLRVERAGGQARAERLGAHGQLGPRPRERRAAPHRQRRARLDRDRHHERPRAVLVGARQPVDPGVQRRQRGLRRGGAEQRVDGGLEGGRAPHLSERERRRAGRRPAQAQLQGGAARGGTEGLAQRAPEQVGERRAAGRGARLGLGRWSGGERQQQRSAGREVGERLERGQRVRLGGARDARVVGEAPRQRAQARGGEQRVRVVGGRGELRGEARRAAGLDRRQREDRARARGGGGVPGGEHGQPVDGARRRVRVVAARRPRERRDGVGRRRRAVRGRELRAALRALRERADGRRAPRGDRPGQRAQVGQRAQAERADRHQRRGQRQPDPARGAREQRLAVAQVLLAALAQARLDRGRQQRLVGRRRRGPLREPAREPIDEPIDEPVQARALLRPALRELRAQRGQARVELGPVGARGGGGAQRLHQLAVARALVREARRQPRAQRADERLVGGQRAHQLGALRGALGGAPLGLARGALGLGRPPLFVLVLVLGHARRPPGAGAPTSDRTPPARTGAHSGPRGARRAPRAGDGSPRRRRASGAAGGSRIAAMHPQSPRALAAALALAAPAAAAPQVELEVALELVPLADRAPAPAGAPRFERLDPATTGVASRATSTGTTRAATSTRTPSPAAAWRSATCDGDGRPDLYLTGQATDSRLYRQRAPWRFEDRNRRRRPRPRRGAGGPARRSPTSTATGASTSTSATTTRPTGST